MNTPSQSAASCFEKASSFFFFFGMEADVFEDEHFSVAQGFALAFSARGQRSPARRPRDCREALRVFRGGPQGIFQIGAAFGTAKMRSQHEAGTFLNGEADGGERFANACVVGDDGVLERNVEINAD